ncbi:hypothetical protein ASPFODRAFT_574092 [Aspergillus luchuensis CBS 106.47]|uniref:Uncharacterized protein n=1 Tax=Aspergillus luchuensis (strain CBS 106.47) TaxID=1137211 RepID=A0A1M3TL34_ASPLC|nr:hypothetical protein ASPFODRAFT_574092 [Aspergillus luchuensis CBS 106.47]
MNSIPERTAHNFHPHLIHLLPPIFCFVPFLHPAYASRITNHESHIPTPGGNKQPTTQFRSSSVNHVSALLPLRQLRPGTRGSISVPSEEKPLRHMMPPVCDYGFTAADEPPTRCLGFLFPMLTEAVVSG